MEPLDYELIEPQQRCWSTDGHTVGAAIMLWGETIPRSVCCDNCGQRYTIVTFEEGLRWHC